MSNLDTTKQGLKKQIIEGLDQAFKQLEEKLSPGSDNYNEYIQINGRYRNLLREVVSGTLDAETVDKIRNQIIQALLMFIDSLDEEDFKPESAAPAQDKRGEILYHIPDKMGVGKEVKCTVRIAWVLEQLLRDWKKSDEDVIKSIRVADIMGVALLNLDESNPFSIRTLSEPIQFLDRDDFTEWIFYVKALRAGNYPLVLRISVVEVINNKEYKKDIVLEEQVVVLAEDVPDSKAAEAFVKLDQQVVVGATEPVKAAEEAVRSAPQSSAPSPNMKRGMSGVLGAVIGLAVFAALGIYFGPKVWQENAWDKAQASKSQQGYKDYLEKYPDGPYAAAAMDSLSSIAAAIQDSIAKNTIIIPEPDSNLKVNPEDIMPPTVPSDTAKTIVPENPSPTNPTPAKPGKDTKVTKPTKNGKPSVIPKPVPPKNTGPLPPMPGKDAPPSNPSPKTDNSAVELQGKVFYFKMPAIPMVEEENQSLSMLLLKFNQDKDVRAVLYNKGANTFKIGDVLTFIDSDGKQISMPFLYIGTFPDKPNLTCGYFGLNMESLQALADNKVKKLQITDTQNGQKKSFGLARKAAKTLSRSAGEAMDKIKAQGL